MAASSSDSKTDGPIRASAIDYRGPRLILGTAAISSTHGKELPTLLQSLSSLPIPITSIDTAPFYPSQRPGYIESLLGSALDSSKLAHEIDTKTMVLSKTISNQGVGELHSQKVRETIQGSVQRLKRPKVRTFSAARPDQDATVAEIAGIFSAKVHEGLCDQWGVCNFSATQLKDLIRTADKRDWHPPKVYQGRYSALHRRRAEKLLDLVESQNMVFVAAHTPTASKSNTVSLSNGANGSSRNGTVKLNVFDMPEVEETVQVLKALEDMHNLKTRAVSLRWLAYHSRLRPEDGIVLEPATAEELKADVQEIAKGPLPEDVVKEIDRAWRAEEDNRPNER